MRIVILGTRGFPNVQGGVEKHCECLSVNLVKLGCEVIVFTRKPYVDKSLKEYKGVTLVVLPAFRNKSLEAFLHTFIGVFFALRYRPDILHIQAIGPAFFTPLARTLGMKVIVTSHGSNYKHLKWGRFAKAVLRLSEFLGVVFSNDVIAISDIIAGEILRNYGRKATVIYNGVTMPETLKSEESLKNFGLEKGKYLLAVGRFVPEKGFGELIEAFNSSLGWKLVIAGDADHQDEYSRRLKELAKKKPGVVLTGFLSGQTLHELYSHAGLFVLPSYYEGLPISLLEAMSYGLSCLASDIPANRNVGLTDDRFFKAGDIYRLREKIIYFMDKPLNEGERAAQITIITEKYNWEKIAKQTLELYRRTLYKK
ncbi:MAG: glycosyltransferase family 4 protein [Candidatus Omnitrophota bacterium]|jgi:glycosyltransferase involved in cell wall biosynthesis